MKCQRCWPLTILLFVTLTYLCLNPLIYYLERVIRLKKLKSSTSDVVENQSTKNPESESEIQSEKDPKKTPKKSKQITNKKDGNLKLNRELLKDISKHDWPDYDFRFKKKNMILVYGWDKYCFGI